MLNKRRVSVHTIDTCMHMYMQKHVCYIHMYTERDISKMGWKREKENKPQGKRVLKLKTKGETLQEKRRIHKAIEA